jgi:hypothetical protein
MPKMKKATALCLVFCIMPCLFIIPVFCAPLEATISGGEDFCPLLAFTVTSDTPLLAETIDSHSLLGEFTFVMQKPEVLNLPVLSFKINKPPISLS